MESTKSKVKGIGCLILYYFLSGIVFLLNGCSSANGEVFYYTYITAMTLVSLVLAVFFISKIKSSLGHGILMCTYGVSLLIGIFNLFSSDSLMFGSFRNIGHLFLLFLTCPSMGFSNGIGDLLNYCDKPAYMWESTEWAFSSNLAQIVFCVAMLVLCYRKSREDE
jgi:hypothetical protein